MKISIPCFCCVVLFVLLDGGYSAKQNPGQSKTKAVVPPEDQTIDDVDEDKIDEIVEDGDRNLVIIFCICFASLYQRNSSI